MKRNCKLDDLRTGFEVLERGAFGHSQTLFRPLSCLKKSSSGKAHQADQPRERPTVGQLVLRLCGQPLYVLSQCVS